MSSDETSASRAKLGNRGLGVEVGIGAEALGGCLYALALGRRVGAQGMLDPATELSEHVLGQVARVLRDEIDADALRADQADNLLDLVDQRLRRIVEQQVGFVEEEDELGLVRVADLGEPLEQFSQQPQQEGGIQTRRVDQGGGIQHIYIAATVSADPHEIGQLQRRFAENVSAPSRSSIRSWRCTAPIEAAATLP